METVAAVITPSMWIAGAILVAAYVLIFSEVIHRTLAAVIGAVTLALAGSFLSFLRLNPDWQIGAQGAILIIVLALRVVVSRLESKQ